MYCLRTGSDQPSFFACGVNTSEYVKRAWCPGLLFERSQLVVITVIDPNYCTSFLGFVY